MSTRLSAQLADITTLHVDVIVNAANSSLLGGGGVDGAIHRAAGPDLLRECRDLGGCKTGDAALTRGYELPARWVVHTVGPVWQDGDHGEPELLASCYRRSMQLAVEQQARTIAFPAISTGVYGYPIEPATAIAIHSVDSFLNEDDTIEQVVFCCFSESDLRVYQRLLVQGSG